MKIARTTRLLAMSMAAVGFLIPQSLPAAAPMTCPTKPVAPAVQANKAFLAVPTSRTAPAAGQKLADPKQSANQLSRATKAKSKTLMQDVALHKGGTLKGQLVDPGGKPISDATVALLQNNRQLATTLTSKQGEFTFTGLRGGIYEVVTSDSNHLYRLWAPGTAPNSSGQIAQVVSGQPILRGQHAVAKVGQWLTSPLGLTAAVATAVAVPVALHNSDRDSAD
ncbi:MAG: carboxypeptidase-like regulatory domain-containing protein [Planctomycetota bacterium]|nr:carboxypeptidase-like regulatory domain-containing protein [Planctomycetota bacterium]